MKKFESEIQRELHQLKQGRPAHFWSALGLFGAVGWLFILPVVGSTYLGWWLDGRYRQAGGVSWTITGILLGVGLGVYLLYQQVYKPALRPKPKPNKVQDVEVDQSGSK